MKIRTYSNNVVQGDAGFFFDAEFSMFRVTCLGGNQYQIAAQFRIIQEDVEENAFQPDMNEEGHHPDDLTKVWLSLKCKLPTYLVIALNPKSRASSTTI